jgi:hypothetical protein
MSQLNHGNFYQAVYSTTTNHELNKEGHTNAEQVSNDLCFSAEPLNDSPFSAYEAAIMDMSA